MYLVVNQCGLLCCTLIIYYSYRKNETFLICSYLSMPQTTTLNKDEANFTDVICIDLIRSEQCESLLSF